MTQTNMPHNAEDWANFLAAKTLPSPFRVGQKVLRKLEKEKLPYARVAKIINNDPILAFYTLCRANDASLEGTPTSKTLAHAISVIGLDELETLIQQQPFKPISLKNITSFYYLRTLCTSLYAAHLGKAISSRKKKGNPEDLYWSSLFVGAPIWYLWRFATPEMRLVRYAIRSNFKLPKTAEKEVLGDTMLNVTTALARKLNLPDLALTCYDPEKSLSLRQWAKIARSFNADGSPLRIEDRQINIQMQSPHFIVMLSNLVAHHSSYCWYSRATLRSQRILASYLHCSLDEAIKITHQAAAEMSRTHPMPGVMLPAAKLFIPPRKRTKAQMECKIGHFQQETFKSGSQEIALSNDTPIDPAQKQESQAGTLSKAISNDTLSQESHEQSLQSDTLEDLRAKKPSPEKVEENAGGKQAGIAQHPTPNNSSISRNPLFVELTNVMSQTPGEFADLHELMNAATQGIAYGIELERACVGLISKDGSRFKNYYSVGCQKHEALKNFESKIVPNTIFDKLSHRPASIWIKRSSEKKILDLIPLNFKNASESKEFFLMSVFVGKKPVAIFFADNNDNQTLTESQYKQFKYLCSAVTTSLQHQANRRSSRIE